jgi:O6-methylguanine-DNA--protein-cysteine methyltransferase
LQPGSGTIDEKAHRIGPSAREISAFEHPLVETGTEKQRGVWRQVAGIEAGSQAAPLVGKEEGV